MGSRGDRASPEEPEASLIAPDQLTTAALLVSAETPQMTLSEIDKLKDEIARLEEEALKELKAKREALIAEIASVDEQIAALVGTVVSGPSPRKRAEKPARSTAPQEAKATIADAPRNNHRNGEENLDVRNDKVAADASPQLADNGCVPAQNDRPGPSADGPVFLPRIPVLGKSPHPTGFSYPLGASAMSEALAGLPMFDRFTLYYSNRTPIFTMVQPLKGFPMLRITYTSYPTYQSRGSTHRFQGGERWAIEVLPTPFDHREFIQKVILEQALPLLREWLASSDLPGSDVRRMAKACWYAVETGLVKWIEEDEARVATG